MSFGTLLLVGLAGGLGALLRFTIDLAITTRRRPGRPVGIFVVNLSGAFLLGLLTGASASDGALRILGTGLLGGYTTFSTLMLDTERLGAGGELRWAAANLAGSASLGLLAAFAGRALTS